MKTPLKNIITGWFTALLGMLLVAFAVASYKFHWPAESTGNTAIAEGITGLVLLFVPKTKIEAGLETIFSRFVERFKTTKS